MKAHVTYSFKITDPVEKFAYISQDIREHYGINLVPTFGNNQGISMSVMKDMFTMEFYLDKENVNYSYLNEWSDDFAKVISKKFSTDITSVSRECKS
jgi:hypothetical protein